VQAAGVHHAKAMLALPTKGYLYLIIIISLSHHHLALPTKGYLYLADNALTVLITAVIKQ
jgi:hypothetical protein